MKLDLRDIIDVPGASLPFTCELDPTHLEFPQIVRYTGAPQAGGEVRNTAGVLTVNASVTAEMVCVCDRCGKEFPSVKTVETQANLTREGESDDPGTFVLDGGWLDVDEVLETAFILDMETKFLCREDCRGVCPTCGKDLNEGPCECRPEHDPRLAVLEQLLDDKDNT